LSTAVGPVIYAIEVNGETVTDFPLDVELRQAWGRHDLFFIRIEYNRTYLNLSTQKLWPDNATIKIIWGRRPSNIQTWYGYVNHHNISANADSGSTAPQITYVCIGTSKVMNSDTNMRWDSVTPTYIARSIAKKYGLRAVLTSTDWLLPFETQANESDFCFMNKIANKTGFRFWVSGGTLYFIDPAVVLRGGNNQAIPTFRLDKMFTKIDTVRQFDMNEGDNIPGQTIAHRSIYGIDDASGLVFQATANTRNSPVISQIKTDRTAPSYSEAQSIVQAWESMNQWWISAKAELFGDVALYPGKIIYLDGLHMPQNTKGYWIVSSATHVLKSSRTTYPYDSRYVSQVEILRNTTGSAPIFKEVIAINPEIMPCTLRSGTAWTAQAATVLYDGRLSV
jgi:hypothetical protein